MPANRFIWVDQCNLSSFGQRHRFSVKDLGWPFLNSVLKIFLWNDRNRGLNALEQERHVTTVHGSVFRSLDLQGGQISGSPYFQSFHFGKGKATQEGHCRHLSWVRRSLTVLRQNNRARYLELKCYQPAARSPAGAVILDLCIIPVYCMDHLSWAWLHGGLRCLVMA